MKEPRNLHSYCLSSTGQFLAFTGPNREADVASVLTSGGRHILTWEFSPGISTSEMVQFREGVKHGYARAMADVRKVLGVSS